jgi:hypothetical protein
MIRAGGAWGIIMRAHILRPLAIGFALSACAIQPAQIADDAQRKMIGLSREQVLACMGPPLNQDAKGTTEVWSYNSGNNVAAAGNGSGRYCAINVTMWNGSVGAVDHLGPSECTFALQKCAANR